MGHSHCKQEVTTVRHRTTHIPVTTEQKDISGGLFKVALIGPAQVGKTTFFRQGREMYGVRFSARERVQWQSAVITEILSAVRLLVISLQSNTDCPGYRPRLRKACERILSLDPTDCPSITSDCVGDLKVIWKDLKVQQLFNERAALFNQTIPDSLSYWMTQLERISEPDYIPTFPDLLRLRSRTTGSRGVELDYYQERGHSHCLLQLVDTGGEQSERFKQMSRLQECDSAIFIVALSQYDQFLTEDETVNCMDESIRLFRVIVEFAKLLHKPCVTLFLSKCDVFQEKLVKQGIPVEKYFPDYTGGPDFEKAIDFFKSAFLSVEGSSACGEESGLRIEVIVGNALDQRDVQNVIRGTVNSLHDACIDKDQQSGFLEDYSNNFKEAFMHPTKVCFEDLCR